MSEWTTLTPEEIELIRREGQKLLAELDTKLNRLIVQTRAHMLTVDEARQLVIDELSDD